METIIAFILSLLVLVVGASLVIKLINEWEK
jgi:hypothetical protein